MFQPFSMTLIFIRQHPEVPQRGFDGGFLLRWNLGGLHAGRQRPAMASPREDAVLAPDSGDLRRLGFQTVFLPHPCHNVRVCAWLAVVAGPWPLDAGLRLVVQIEVSFPVFMVFDYSVCQRGDLRSGVQVCPD